MFGQSPHHKQLVILLLKLYVALALTYSYPGPKRNLHLLVAKSDSTYNGIFQLSAESTLQQLKCFSC